MCSIRSTWYNPYPTPHTTENVYSPYTPHHIPSPALAVWRWAGAPGGPRTELTCGRKWASKATSLRGSPPACPQSRDYNACIPAADT